MRWFVARDGKTYGPYTAAQLSAFVTPEMPVLREGETRWVSAAEDPALEGIFLGTVVPELEWYVKRAGGKELGPYARSAVLEMFRRNQIRPEDSIRYKDWPRFVPVRRSKIYLRWKEPLGRLEGEESEKVFPEQSHPRPAAVREREKFDGREIPRLQILLIVVVLIGLPGYGAWLWHSYNAGIRPAQHPVVRKCGGLPKADCRRSNVSRCICEERPKYCGCREKGECGMESCVKYREILENPPPPEAVLWNR